MKQRLSELTEAFEKSDYPKDMLVNISSKVLNMQRILNQSSSTSEDTNSKPVLIVSCFGTDEKLVKR